MYQFYNSLSMNEATEPMSSDARTVALEWRSFEHSHKETKSQDWFWTLGTVALAIAVAAILLGNALFGVLILLAALVLGLSVNQKPAKISYAITTRGLVIDDTLHPYKNLEAFWIDETSHPKRNMLIIDAQKPLMPHIIINLPDSVDRDALQDYLLDYLPEEELYEPASHRIAELFGF